MFNPGVPAAFKEIDETDQIGVDVGVRINEGITHTSLGGEIDHGIETVLLEQPLNGWPVCEFHIYVAEAVTLGEGRHPGLFQLRVVIVVEIVKPYDLGSCGYQLLTEMGANKTSSSGYKNLLHCFFPV